MHTVRSGYRIREECAEVSDCKSEWLRDFLPMSVIASTDLTRRSRGQLIKSVEVVVCQCEEIAHSRLAMGFFK